MIGLAVVGAGSMGANHGRVAMGLRDARVTVVVDPDPARGQRLASAVGCDYRPTTAGIGEVAEAAVVAVPTTMHREVSEDLFDQGLSVLLEKPISHDIESATAIVAAAQRSGKVLLVGHIERFNPAVAELDRLVTDPIHFEATRISPFVSRVTDGVIVDLMIHDLDIVRSLSGGEVSRVSAVARTTRSATEDLAVALLEFDNGVTATLTASRIGQEKIRRLSITQSNDYLAVDLMRQEVTLHRIEEVSFIEGGSSGYRQRGFIEIPFLSQRGEPLYRELEHFVHCIQGEAAPRVTGDDGVVALSLCFDVMEAAGVADRGS
jgi:predicted dehydrogenase